MNILAHTSFIGTTGYANHAQSFFIALDKLNPLKVRNFTVPTYWNGYNPEPFDNENYLTDLDRKLLVSQALFGKESNINFLHVSTINIYKNLLEKYFKY